MTRLSVPAAASALWLMARASPAPAASTVGAVAAGVAGGWERYELGDSGVTRPRAPLPAFSGDLEFGGYLVRAHVGAHSAPFFPHHATYDVVVTTFFAGLAGVTFGPPELSGGPFIFQGNTARGFGARIAWHPWATPHRHRSYGLELRTAVHTGYYSYTQFYGLFRVSWRNPPTR